MQKNAQLKSHQVKCIKNQEKVKQECQKIQENNKNKDPVLLALEKYENNRARKNWRTSFFGGGFNKKEKLDVVRALKESLVSGKSLKEGFEALDPKNKKICMNGTLGKLVKNLLKESPQQTLHKTVVEQNTSQMQHDIHKQIEQAQLESDDARNLPPKINPDIAERLIKFYNAEYPNRKIETKSDNSTSLKFTSEEELNHFCQKASNTGIEFCLPIRAKEEPTGKWVYSNGGGYYKMSKQDEVKTEFENNPPKEKEGWLSKFVDGVTDPSKCIPQQ